MRTEGGGWVRGIYSLTIPRAPEAIGHFEAGTGMEYWRGLCSGNVTTSPGQTQAAISVDATGTVALCEAIVEQLRIKPHPLLAPKRIAGRQAIGRAVSAWCKRGLGDDAHRNARILRFPYLTRYKPKDGNVLEISKRGEMVLDPITKESVQLPATRAGLLMIFRTFEKMSYGLVLHATQPLAVMDTVANP